MKYYDMLVLIILAAFSAIMITGTFVFPDTIFGIPDASTTLKFLNPFTLSQPLCLDLRGLSSYTCQLDVIDRRLKVKGFKNPRAVNASVMPKLMSANTNAAMVMITEKAADLIKQAIYTKLW